MKSLIIFSLMLIVMWQPCAIAQIYRWVDENGQVHFSDKPPPGQQAPVQNVIADSSESFLSDNVSELQDEQGQDATYIYNQPTSSETLRVRRLFEAGKFEELNNLIYQVHLSIERDILLEPQLESVFLAFKHKGSNWDVLFNQWLTQFPDNYQGYLARATYRVYLGWEARGGRYIHKTPDENIRKMQEYFAHAQQDIQQVFRLNEKALYGYCLQISIYTTSGNHRESYGALQKALTYYPTTYLARRDFMHSLQPVWGGSLEAINAFAAQSQEHVQQNSNLKQLLGYSQYSQGRIEYLDKHYDEAIRLFTQALEYGNHPRSYDLRGKSYYWKKDYTRALADFNRAIESMPEEAGYYYWRARSYVAMNRPAEAFTDINRAHALKPDDEKINRVRQQLLSRIRLPGEGSAGTLSENSLPDPKDAEALFNYARAQIAKNELVEAKRNLDSAIELKPREFRYYQLIDHVLFKMGKTREILNYWQAYLKYQPNDGRAYFERSGTYYHLQDFEAAKADARRAMELGVKEAEHALKRLNALTR